jgi:type VI secretion system secreted protein VgrG
MNFRHARLVAWVGFAAVCVCGGTLASAATAPNLGTAGNFVVLGGSTVTNTGSSVLTGDLGVWPGLAIIGFPPGIVNGTTHAGDAVALQAQSDLVTAYNNVAGQMCDTDLTGTDLGGLTLLPGAYCFSTSAQLTGTLTLDAQGDPNAVFLFQIGSSLTTASNAVVDLINGGSSCNVFWQVGSSATLGTSTAFAGSILALTSITSNTSVSLSGQLLARNGAVTLDTITGALCDAAGSPFPGVEIPTLSGWAMILLAVVLALAGFATIRRTWA